MIFMISDIYEGICSIYAEVSEFGEFLVEILGEFSVYNQKKIPEIQFP